MKYFVISDIHGHYKEMLAALQAAGFDEEDRNHTLISLGDAFDRGSESSEVLDYLMSLERKILIRGNHEDMLEGLLTGKRRIDIYDDYNGTAKTLLSLASVYNERPYLDEDLMICYDEILKKAKKSRALRYIHECIPYFETNGYIFIHGWMPLDDEGHPFKAEDPLLWEHARWQNGFKESEKRNFYKKTIVCGHVPAILWNHEFLGMDSFEPFVSQGVIAMDSCVYKTHRMYAYVIED